MLSSFKSIRAVSPVVATALLLVVAVSAVVGFSSWISEFNSNLFVDVESDSSSSSSVRVEGIFNDVLYLNSKSNFFFSEFKLVSNEGDEMCEFRDDIKNNFNGDTVLLFDFDSDSVNSTHIKDKSGYNNDAIADDVECMSPGYYGNSCSFVNDSSRLLVFDSLELNVGYEDYSICFTYKPTTVGGITRQIFSKRDSNASSEFQIQSNNQSIYLTRENTTISNINTYLSEINEYHTTCIVRSEDNTSIYLNSNLESFVINSLNLSSSSNLHIGEDIYQNEDFYGEMDEIYFYKRALSQKEVSYLYSIKKAVPYESFLMEGLKKIDISSCNLKVGQSYNFIGFTNSGNKVDSWVVVK